MMKIESIVEDIVLLILENHDPLAKIGIIKDKLFVLYDEVYFTALVSSNLSLPRAEGAILPVSCSADTLATVGPSSLTLARPVDLASA